MKYYDSNSNYPFSSGGELFHDIDSIIFVIPDISCGPCKHKILRQTKTILNSKIIFTKIKDKARLDATIKDYDLLEKGYIKDYENTYNRYIRKNPFFIHLVLKSKNKIEIFKIDSNNVNSILKAINQET